MGYYDNSGKAVPWLKLDTNRNGASLDFTLLPEVLVNHANYTGIDLTWLQTTIDYEKKETAIHPQVHAWFRN